MKHVISDIKKRIGKEIANCYKEMNKAKRENNIYSGHIYDECYNQVKAYKETLKFIDETFEKHKGKYVPVEVLEHYIKERDIAMERLRQHE